MFRLKSLSLTASSFPDIFDGVNKKVSVKKVFVIYGKSNVKYSPLCNSLGFTFDLHKTGFLTFSVKSDYF